MNSWILFSFIASLATSFITIIIRYLNKYGNANYLEFYMLIVLFIIFLFLAIYLEFNPKKRDLRSMKNNSIIGLSLLALSILSIVAVYFSSRAHMIAPNPAYSSTIININIVFVLILSMILFKSPINVYTGCGIILVLFGAILIALNSDNKRKK